MEAVSRWLCSFVAYKDVRVQIHTTTTTCGENVLLCSIKLTDPRSTFKDYYENKISVLYYDIYGRNAEAVGDCVVDVAEVNSRQLDVYCRARRAGRAKVRLDLGKWYYFTDKEINVDILPSSPKYLKNVKVSCCEKPVDEDHRPEIGTLYYGTKTLLKFKMVDEYGNFIKQIQDEKYYVTIELYDKNMCKNVYNPLEWGMKNGEIFGIFLPSQFGETQMMVRFVEKRLNSTEESTCTYKMPINILYPPCSPSLTLKFLDVNLEEPCTVGKEHIFTVQLYDIFGKAVLQDSKATCNIVVQAPLPKSALKQHGKDWVEGEKIEKIYSSENSSVAVTVCFKIAGVRRLKLIANSGSKSCSKGIYVNALPSTPHYLNDVRFTTDGAIDPSFSADPTMMYMKQWSILEASIVDCYENVVQELGNDHNICLKLFNSKGKKVGMEYKDAEIQNGTLRVRVKIDDAGNHNLLITLTSKTLQVFRLKEIQIKINDTPFYLAGSEFCCPDICVAGKEFQVKIIPFDVFGCHLPANSTTDYNLSAEISQMSTNEEIIGLKVNKNELNILICFSVVLAKGGSRELMIFDRDNKLKELSFEVNPDLNDAHWQLTATRTETAYRRENLILTIHLLDRFNNEVRNDSSETIPDLLKQAGPNGLHCTGKSMQGNTWKIRYYFDQTGTYDLCLADRDGNSREGTSFTVIVQDAPLDHSRSSITWLPRYDDIPDQPVFPDDESLQCCLKLKDVVDCNYDAKIPKECFEVRYGGTKVKNITVSSSANEIGSYVIVVPLLNLVKVDPSPTFWCFVNGVKVENPLVLPTFEGFNQHDDEDCFVVRTRKSREFSIVCRYVKENDIIGKDFCHLNNIKRVCELDEDPDVFESDQDEPIGNDFVDYDDDGDDGDDGDYGIGDYDDNGDDDSNSDAGGSDYGVDDDEFFCTIITLPRDEIAYKVERNQRIKLSPKEIENKLLKCRNILLRLLRAIYYREEAFDADKAREDWRDRASESYKKNKGDRNKRDRPRFCSQIKEKYAKLMRRYHDAACEEFFQFFNTDRVQSEIDLHGLLVVDESKLQGYERQLRDRGQLDDAEVERKIKEERDHGNEAIRKLRERLDNYDMEKAKKEGEPWLEIIVGSGHHSKIRQQTRRQQIRKKVEKYLKRTRKLEFKPVNKGALVVTFEKYSGTEPCFGEYYCTKTKCDSRWRNGRSWIGKWQACYKCNETRNSLEKCYPLKQRKRRKPKSYNPKILPRRQQPPIPHVEELCEKCIELGELCPCSPY